jgi:ribosomal protein S18 acetylase RimI-like enzyme
MTQPAITIRQATASDAQAIAEIQVRSWQWAYRTLIPDYYLDSLSATLERRIEAYREQIMHLPAQHSWWIVEEAKCPAGFTMTGPSRDLDVSPMVAEVFAIYLSPNTVGKGLGRTLFKHAVEDLQQGGYAQATLWVLENNTRARTFYEAAGWALDGSSKNEERSGFVLHEVRYHINFR